MIVLGVVVGHFWPRVGVAMQPVAEGFINLIKIRNNLLFVWYGNI